MRRVLAFLFCLLAAPSWALSPAQEIILLGGSGQSYYASPAATGKLPPWLSYASAGVRYYFDAAGSLQTSPNNLILNSAVFSTQTVAVTSGASYVLSATMASGNSIAATGGATTTLSGTGAGSRVYTSFTASSASVTLALTGAATQAQLEQVTAAQTAPNPFMPTYGSAYYGPVVNDHNPSTLAALGLRSEPQRTNAIKNSAMVGVALHQPPTNWPASYPNTVNGVTYDLVAFGTTNGTPWVGILITGTPTVTSNSRIVIPSQNTDTTAAAGQTWTQSWMMSVNNSVNASFALAFYGFQSDGATVSESYNNVISPTATLAPMASTQALSTASTAYIRPGITLSYTSGLQIGGSGAGITLQIALPKIEQNSFATSPILTYGTAVTVPADNWSFTGAALARSTVAACVAIQTLAEGALTGNRLFGVSDGTLYNRVGIKGTSNTLADGFVVKAGTTIRDPNGVTGGDMTTAPRTSVISYGAGVIAQYAYDGTLGGAGIANTAGSPSGMTQALLGQTVGGPPFYGWYQQIMIRPSCTAAQVQRYSTAGANLRGN